MPKVVVEVEVHLNKVMMVDQVVVLPITQTQVQVVKQLNHLNQVTQALTDLVMMVELHQLVIQVVVELEEAAEAFRKAGETRYAAQLGKPLQPPDGGIARVGLLADIIKQQMPVVGAHRNDRIRTAFGAAANSSRVRTSSWRAANELSQCLICGAYLSRGRRSGVSGVVLRE